MLGNLIGIVALIGAIGPAPIRADEGPAPADPQEQLAARRDELGREMQKLGDWSNQAEVIHRAIESIWANNHWDAEADLFAKQAAMRISEIPPWDLEGRVDALSGILSERYDFRDEQSAKLKSMVWQESTWLMLKHAGILLNQTREAVATRRVGRPFTPEQIAAWTRDSQPVWEDARERMDRIVRTLESTMDKRQKAILQRDLESLNRRMKYFDEHRKAWMRGEWKPQDWGLENDPIQRQRADPRAAKRRPARQAAPRRPGRPLVLPYDENTWERYVRAFIRTYRLDPAQRQTAYSILREVRERAAQHRRTHPQELRPVPRAQRWTHPGFSPIRTLYYEMKARLDRIPTDAQRTGRTPNIILDSG